MSDDLLPSHDGLTALLHRNTAHLVAAPDVLIRARTRGRQLQRRRHAMTAVATLVLVAGGLGAVASVVGPVSDRTEGFAAGDAFAPFVDHPTSGDLANDASYLSKVLDEWQRSHATSSNRDRGVFDDLRGEPHVVWAGTTEAGPAALVEQKAFLHRHGDIQLDREGVSTLLGFVGLNSRGAPTVVGDTYTAPGVNPSTAWFVDPNHTVLAALSENQPIGYADGWTYRPDGKTVLHYTALKARDGVAVGNVPSGDSHSRVYVSLLPSEAFSDRDWSGTSFIG